jgi:O-antigen ligase
MIDRVVFGGLCAVLFFVPLPIGSVEEWAVFVFEAATLLLFLLYLIGQIFERKRTAHAGFDPGFDAGESGSMWDGWSRYDHRPARLPGFFKFALGVFAAVSLLQLVPLPSGLVRLVSPRAYALYAGLVNDGIAAPASSLTLSFSPSATVSELVLIFCYGVFGFLLLRTVRTRLRAEILVAVILVAALFQSFYGMAEVFSGHEAILGRAKKYNIGSVTGTYVNRNHLAGFLEMAFPLSLGYLLVKARYFAMEKGLSLRQKILWFGQESLQWTFLLGLAPVFIGVGLVFSKSRSGIMVLAVTAILTIIAAASWREFSEENGETGRRHRQGRQLGRFVRIVVMAVLVAAVWLGIGPIIKRFSEVDVTTEGRRTFYKNTIDMIRDFPGAGIGKGDYVNAYEMYEKVDDNLKLSYAHNDYLEFFAENGILGGGALIFAGIGLVVWLAAMWRRRRSSFAKGIGLGALLGVTAILVHAFTDFNLQIPANAVYFTALAMLGVVVLGSGRGRTGGHVPQIRVPVPSPQKNKNKKRDTYPGDMSPFKSIGAVVLAVALFVPAFRDFLGFQRLSAYRRARLEARSVESAFPTLDASLARAVSASPRAVFRIEQARLYVEMARVSNDAGRDEDRDMFCDQAIAAYNRAIAANPIDAAAHFEAAMTYLLYNYPLMTYQDRAKSYFREALVFKPADETINLNVIFLYFAWWPTLEEAEKEYAAGVYRKMVARDTAFPPKLEARWKLSFPTLDGLNAVLAELPSVQ